MQSSRKQTDDKRKTTSLAEDFQLYFDVDLATTREMQLQTYRTRYRVYCEEFNYEAADAFPDGLETDEFEAQSLHCLVTHKSSGRAAGCMRLVCVEEQQILPMEKFCASVLDRAFIDSLGVPRETFGEFSRLAVDGAFRRRSGENVSRFGALTALDCSKRELRTFSLIAVATFLAGFAAADLVGRHNLFAMMEPFLPRMLKRAGIHAQSAGTPIDYHGLRAPYFTTSEQALADIGPELRELYATVHARFSRQAGLLQARPGGGGIASARV
ncbi:MAG: PEP-CTERM/exosortase system-associated acyltransferase [Halioglobus sp.]|nr:PEP-CTERM/exosortase system-associated acyltransferase [Halioglobus sp.]